MHRSDPLHHEGPTSRTESAQTLLDKLQAILEKQIELAREGDTSEVHALTEKASLLVQQIAPTGILRRPQMRSRREQLAKLYGRLALALTARRDETARKLRQVRQGRKTLRAYRSSVL
jgi:hypothetical protein